PNVEGISATFICPSDTTRRDSNVTFADKPPASVVLSAAESSQVMLYQEQSNFVLPSPVSVDLSLPGLVAGKGSVSPATIPAGTPVDCYLLHYDPPGPNGTVQNIKVAFSGKIIGVICLTAPLCASDSVLGNPDTKYDENLGARGMELGDEIVNL